jgi:ABC-type oligopeptide transport system substrate-binding subunit
VLKKKEAMMYGMGWGADYPDAENFFKILYGPNGTPGANNANYQDKEFDKMFEEASVMEPSPERTLKYEAMTEHLANQVPVIFGVHRVRYALQQGWLKNYKFTEFDHGVRKYYDIDQEKKKVLRKK